MPIKKTGEGKVLPEKPISKEATKDWTKEDDKALGEELEEE